jgi:toxin CcdB
MAQFDVHDNPVKPDSERIPFLLDVQSDFLDVLPTRVVVPLVRTEFLRQRIPTLHPELVVASSRVVMVTSEIGVLPRHALGTAVLNLGGRRAEIIGALDMLITGS